MENIEFQLKVASCKLLTPTVLVALIGFGIPCNHAKRAAGGAFVSMRHTHTHTCT